MHIDDDKLLRYALEVIDDDENNEREEIEGHLEVCQLCRARLSELRNDIEIISGIRPRRPGAATRGHSWWHNAVQRSLRAAAFIILGLAIGFGASSWLKDEPTRVTMQYVTLSSPVDSVCPYAATDATEISSGYERRVLQDAQ
jgi:hypothetical protein